MHGVLIPACNPPGFSIVMSSIRVTALCAAFLSCLALGSAGAAEPTGTWLTQKGDAHIRIAPCGPALCGTIVWTRDKVDPRTGRPPVDSSNPDPRKRHRRIVGLRIFAMRPHGRDGWTGPIYNADDGQTYAGKLIPRGAGTLEVRGCAGVICGSETWRRIAR